MRVLVAPEVGPRLQLTLPQEGEELGDLLQGRRGGGGGGGRKVKEREEKHHHMEAGKNHVHHNINNENHILF